MEKVVWKCVKFLFKIKKRSKKRLKNEIPEYNLQLHAQNASGFDTWIILNNIPCDKQFVKIVKNGKGIIELKVSNDFFQNYNKQTLQYLRFSYDVTHLNYSIKKTGKTFELQKKLIKTEMNPNEVDGNN